MISSDELRNDDNQVKKGLNMQINVLIQFMNYSV